MEKNCVECDTLISAEDHLWFCSPCFWQNHVHTRILQGLNCDMCEKEEVQVISWLRCKHQACAECYKDAVKNSVPHEQVCLKNYNNKCPLCQTV